MLLHLLHLLLFVIQFDIPDHSMGTNIMRMLVEIKQLLQQSILLNQQRGIPGATAEVEEEEFSLPLTSTQELLNLEERLRGEQSIRRKLVQSTDVLEAVRWRRRSSLFLWPLSRSSSIWRKGWGGSRVLEGSWFSLLTSWKLWDGGGVLSSSDLSAGARQSGGKVEGGAEY